MLGLARSGFAAFIYSGECETSSFWYVQEAMVLRAPAPGLPRTLPAVVLLWSATAVGWGLKKLERSRKDLGTITTW